MRHLSLTLFVILMLAACSNSSPTPPAVPEDFQQASLAEVADNRLLNPGFEEINPTLDTTDDAIAQGWLPFYCAPPFTLEACPAERIGEGNPDDLTMAKPTYRAASRHFRVSEGRYAQHW